MSEGSHESSDYSLCTPNSSTETRSDLVGAGRTLGNVFGFLGRRLERATGNLAHRLGRGPRATAMKILKIHKSSLRLEVRRRKLEKAGASLVKYIRHVST